jgi:hypothetical protein
MVFHIEDALKVFHQSTQGGDASLFDGVKTGVHTRPHLTDPDWPQDNSPGKQPEGTGTTQKGNEEDERKSRSKQCYSLIAALGAISTEDWCRTWAGGRTIMLSRTLKRIKESLDKMRPRPQWHRC